MNEHSATGGRGDSAADERRFHDAISTISDAFYALDAEWRLVAFNDAAERYFGFGSENVVGKNFWTLFPQGRGTSFGNALEAAMQKRMRSTLRTESTLTPGKTINVTVAPWDDGICVAIKDVTEGSQAQHQLQESEERLRLAADAAAIGTWDFNPVSGELRWDPRCKALFGLSPTAPVSYETAFLAGLHPDDRDRADAAVQAALAPGGSPGFDIEYRTIGIEDGVERWIAAKGKAIFEGAAAVRFIGTVLDISPRKRAERRFEVVNRTGAQVAAEHDVDAIVQAITDAGVELTGAEFGAFFYNKVDERGESYMLYALSGVPREAFAQFPMPRKTAVFAPTFTGEGVVRSDDIRADPRYGKSEPHKGMPPGHLPVHSYLAVPVMAKTGEVLGGLFFGHQDFGVFRPEHETLLLGLAGQAATAIENSRLIEALKTLNATLEQRVMDEVLERVRAQELLRQSQKMEAIGQLTGGIAHDFNNMLAAVIGALNLMQIKLDRGDTKVQKYVDAAMDGATRASSLTKRLLAFSRQQPLASAPLDANGLIIAMTDLLTRSLGEDVQVETVLADGLWRCYADSVQLESTLLNLAVNARDAMPDGGKLKIDTANISVTPSNARDYGVPEGQYVRITASDTGAGMSQEVIAQAFEPFFTTKAVGKGSGLGLSQVLGFVQQSGGHVKLDSQIGAGTTVTLYLPRHVGPDTEAASDADVAASVRGGGETVLVVEDEERVRNYSIEALEELGYRVVAAEGPLQALKLIESGARLDVLFTDIVMPDMNGRQLAIRALERMPHLKVLYTTGHAGDAISDAPEIKLTLLRKPFTIDQLAAKLRQVIEE